MTEPQAGTGTGNDLADVAQGAGAATITKDDPAETDEAFDPERAMATIKKLRAQEKTATAALREHAALRAQLKALEDAKLSDQEKAAKRLAELEAKEQAWEAERRTLTLNQAIMAAGQRQRAIDPELLTRLVEVDEEREVEAAVSRLRRDRPYLFHSLNGSADGGASPPAGTSVGMNDLIRRAVGR